MVSSEVSLFGLQMAVFSLCLHVVCPMCVCVLISSYKNTSQVGSGPTPITSFNLNYLFKDYLQIQSHWGIRATTYEFWRCNSVYNKPQIGKCESGKQKGWTEPLVETSQWAKSAEEVSADFTQWFFQLILVCYSIPASLPEGPGLAWFNF